MLLSFACIVCVFIVVAVPKTVRFSEISILPLIVPPDLSNLFKIESVIDWFIIFDISVEPE